jgi:hypothetical protein
VRRVLANALLLLATLAVAFVVGEVAVRALYAEQSTLFPRYHTDYRYGNYVVRGIRPNADFWHTSVDGRWRFVTNSRGFRDEREFAYAKPAGTLRVLALGDSHTQGYEVAQDATFSAVLERALRARGIDAEVINTGVSGFSNAEALAFLENEGYRYEPDVVVLGFFANDFEDNVKAGLFDIDDKGTLVARRFEHVPGVTIQNLIYRIPGIRWLGENSYFYSLLFNEVWNFFKLRLGVQAARDAASRSGTAPVDDTFEYAVPTQASASTYQVELASGMLSRMQAFCMAKNIRFIVLDVPDYVERFRARTSIPSSMLAALDRAGIEVVSSEALFRAYEGTADMHVAHGHHHISSFSHTVIGVELARRVLAPGSSTGPR